MGCYTPVLQDVTLSPTRDQKKNVKSRQLARAEDAEEWIKDGDGMEWMHGQNSMIGRLVSTPDSDDEQDDVVRIGVAWSCDQGT